MYYAIRPASAKWHADNSSQIFYLSQDSRCGKLTDVDNHTGSFVRFSGFCYQLACM